MSEETSWVIVTMHRDNPNGGRTDVELLRPKEWVTSRGIKRGTSFHFTASEENLSGVMTVDTIQPLERELGPFFREDQTAMITGRFVTQKAQVYRVTFAGENTEVRVTGNHPLYSLDRNSWVAVENLRPGERLRTHDESVVVESVELLG